MTTDAILDAALTAGAALAAFTVCWTVRELATLVVPRLRGRRQLRAVERALLVAEREALTE